MIALAEPRPTLLAALRLSGKATLGLAGTCLTAVTIGLAALMFSHHDPDGCKYGEPPHIENGGMPKLPIPPVTQIVSSGTVDLFNRCPGSFSYSTGDFKPH